MKGSVPMSNTIIANSQPLSPIVRTAITLTAAIDMLIGLAFLLGPELGLTLWPTPIPLALMRFIGAIVLANGVGALMIVRRPIWENARVLFTVAMVYGIVVLLALLYQLLLGSVAPIFWVYVVVDAIFLVPIAYIYWSYERATTLSRPASSPA
jgi:hypothetical protein